MEEKQDRQEANLNYAGWRGEQGRTPKAHLGETELGEGNACLAKGPWLNTFLSVVSDSL